MLNKTTLYIFIVLVVFSKAIGQEQDVTEIILEGSAKDKTLEMSGLTWYKDKLILLPQYIDYDDPAFYSISKSRINKWLNEESKKPIIQDRTIYEDAHIFAPNLKAMGLMNQRDFKNYQELFELLESLIKGPDLLVYLRSSIPNLVNKIHKRGRDYEISISIDYLSRLNERYEAWISTYDKGEILIIDVDDLDFVEKKDDFMKIVSKIDGLI